MGKHHTDDYKQSAINYYFSANEPSIRDTCVIFNCKRESLRRWIKRYIITGSVSNKPRPEGSYKITKTHVNFILNVIKLKPNITLWQILGLFHEKFKNITLSKTHLINIIKYTNLTYKKYSTIHKPDFRYNKPINHKQEYSRFYNKIKKYDVKNIICIDETSIQTGLHFNKCRFEIGKRCKKITKSNEIFKKYTLIMAIGYYGIIDWTLYKYGGINNERLVSFLNRKILKNNNKLILMDNASAHKKQNVIDSIKNSNNDYVHIVPYQHNMNCIERFFNQLKHYIKLDEPMNFNEIGVSIKNALEKISKDNYKNYFESTYTKKNIINDMNNVSKYHKKPKKYKD